MEARFDNEERSQERRCPRCGREFDAEAAFCPEDGARLVEVEADAPLPLGSVLDGHLMLTAFIDSGATGQVYRARQLGLERDVAVKVLRRELLGDEEALRRFHREARVLAGLDHPHLVRIYSTGALADGTPFLVMEFLRGESLAARLSREGAFRLDRALRILHQVCEAVGAAHARGIVHRDLKPENILLVDEAGEADFVKVVDFGVCRLLSETVGSHRSSGLVFGTPHYLSPEAATGQATDARSDVYSLGIVLFELLCGLPPFTAPTLEGILRQHATAPLPDVRLHLPRGSCPDWLVEVLKRALAKAPRDRFRNAHELGDALQGPPPLRLSRPDEADEGRAVTIRPAFWQRPWFWLATLGVASALILVALVRMGALSLPQLQWRAPATSSPAPPSSTQPAQGREPEAESRTTSALRLSWQPSEPASGALVTVIAHLPSWYPLGGETRVELEVDEGDESARRQTMYAVDSERRLWVTSLRWPASHLRLTTRVVGGGSELLAQAIVSGESEPGAGEERAGREETAPPADPGKHRHRRARERDAKGKPPAASPPPPGASPTETPSTETPPSPPPSETPPSEAPPSEPPPSEAPPSESDPWQTLPPNGNTL